jgi:6-pyruvoyltetrahydropterin/6-carboxytetrahydropterin synthase
MQQPYVEITRREEFSAAHRLHNPALSEAENLALFGICNNLYGHGHNYAFEVTLGGPVPAMSGMVMDLNVLMGILKAEVVQQLDHKHLNHDVPWLAGRVTTAENLAVAIWERVAPQLARHAGAQLIKVRVFESRDNFVEYRGRTA